MAHRYTSPKTCLYNPRGELSPNFFQFEQEKDEHPYLYTCPGLYETPTIVLAPQTKSNAAKSISRVIAEHGYMCFQQAYMVAVYVMNEPTGRRVGKKIAEISAKNIRRRVESRDYQTRLEIPAFFNYDTMAMHLLDISDELGNATHQERVEKRAAIINNMTKETAAPYTKATISSKALGIIAAQPMPLSRGVVKEAPQDMFMKMPHHVTQCYAHLALSKNVYFQVLTLEEHTKYIHSRKISEHVSNVELVYVAESVGCAVGNTRNETYNNIIGSIVW